MSSQRTYTASDARLRKELEELQQSKVTDALDVQMRENAFAQRLQEEASNAMKESQQELVQQFQANFEQYRLRAHEEHREAVSELQEQNDELQERLESKALKTLRVTRAKGDSKPKVKEAEVIKLPEFPTPESYRSWKTAAREKIRAAFRLKLSNGCLRFIDQAHPTIAYEVQGSS